MMSCKSCEGTVKWEEQKELLKAPFSIHFTSDFWDPEEESNEEKYAHAFTQSQTNTLQ